MFDYQTFFYVEKCKEEESLEDFDRLLLEKIMEIITASIF